MRVLTAGAVAVSLVALVLLPLNGEYQRGVAEVRERSTQPVALDVALVNEDRGLDAGGEQLNLGRGYVTQIESDTSAAWHVVSRGVAEHGLAYGDFHLMVIIPAEFSEKLLDLGSADPSPIGVTYQVNGGGNVRVEAVADERGREIVAHLNEQLVDMYVASILGNLRQAQDNVQLVVETEAANAGVFVDEVDPATRAFGVDLSALTQSIDGSVEANGSLATGLDGLGSDLVDSTEGHGEHGTSLAELITEREAGALTYGTFLESLMAMDSRLLSDEIQQLYDDLVATGDALTAQFDVDSEQPTHAAAVTELEAVTTEVETWIAARLEHLDGLGAQDALAAYAAEVRDLLDRDDRDGVLTLAEVLVYAEDAGTGPAPGPEMAAVLRQAVEDQIDVLPYRNGWDLKWAIEENVFGHAGGQFDDAAQKISDGLATIEAWEGYLGVPNGSEIIGGGLDERVHDLLAAQSAFVEPEPEPVPEPEPELGAAQVPPTLDQKVRSLTGAAAAYGAEVTRITDAFERAVELVEFADECRTSCGLPPDVDVTTAVDAVLIASVERQVAAERTHLVGSAGLVDRLRDGTSQIASTSGQLHAATQQLAVDITGQLDSLAGLRTSMQQVVEEEGPAARSVAESDAMTRTIVGEAQGLAASSESLALSAQAGAEQAAQITTLLEGLRVEVEGLLGDAADLDQRSVDLTGALTGQVDSSRAFADSFAGVLPNAHSSGVLNERLMRFLVEPVVPTQREPVASADVTRPFPWVLITFAVCFMAAHLLANVTWVARQRSAFARGRAPWFRSNARTLGISSAAGAVLGVGLAWASGAGLAVPRESWAVWGVAVTLISLGMTLLAHWLVEQWGRVGVGLCVVLLVGYVFVSDAIGTPATSGVSGVMAKVNPLSHAEGVLRDVLGQNAGGIEVLGRLLVWVVLAVVLNLLVQEDLRRLAPRRRRPVPA
ncbi:type VII secretion protein EsaA [Cellulomonas sp. Marseille-Q8402]